MSKLKSGDTTRNIAARYRISKVGLETWSNFKMAKDSVSSYNYLNLGDKF